MSELWKLPKRERNKNKREIDNLNKALAKYKEDAAYHSNQLAFAQFKIKTIESELSGLEYLKFT
jgi:Holliday junction resolvase RusA-like endonuclease